ncbi:MAG TPA: hypothetical protein VGG46_03895 [Terriglobales bacterium]
MTILGYIFFWILVLICEVFWLCWFRDLGYKAGYEAGRREADDWWTEAEDAVDETRKQVWREEAKKGMWL